MTYIQNHIEIPQSTPNHSVKQLNRKNRKFQRKRWHRCYLTFLNNGQFSVKEVAKKVKNVKNHCQSCDLAYNKKTFVCIYTYLLPTIVVCICIKGLTLVFKLTFYNSLFNL